MPEVRPELLEVPELPDPPDWPEDPDVWADRVEKSATPVKRAAPRSKVDSDVNFIRPIVAPYGGGFRFFGLAAELFYFPFRGVHGTSPRICIACPPNPGLSG